MTKRTLGWLLILALPVMVQQPSAQTKPPMMVSPPEVKNTVEAITSRWSGQVTAHVKGSAVDVFSWTIDCKPIALGAGAFVY